MSIPSKDYVSFWMIQSQPVHAEHILPCLGKKDCLNSMCFSDGLHPLMMTYVQIEHGEFHQMANALLALSAELTTDEQAQYLFQSVLIQKRA